METRHKKQKNKGTKIQRNAKNKAKNTNKGKKNSI